MLAENAYVIDFYAFSSSEQQNQRIKKNLRSAQKKRVIHKTIHKIIHKALGTARKPRIAWRQETNDS